MNLLDVLISILQPRRAEAEVVPGNEEAAQLLNAAMPAYGDIIRAAQRDPRQVHVYAGNPFAEALGTARGSVNSIVGTNAVGLYAPTPGYQGAGVMTEDPNTVMVRTPEMATSVAEWLGLPYPRGADPQGAQQQVLAHELSHFLMQGKPIQGEFNADLVAANPDEAGLAAIQRMTRPNEPVHGEFGADEYMYSKWRSALLEALGQFSPMFMGPREEQKPLRFDYKEPEYVKPKSRRRRTE